MGTNILFRIINNFKMEDSFARTKFQQCVAGNYSDLNPGRTRKAQARIADMKAGIDKNNTALIKEVKSWGNI